MAQPPHDDILKEVNVVTINTIRGNITIDE
jgi:hypothetical protein